MSTEHRKTPHEISIDPSLSKQEKISLLMDWAYEEKQKTNATEENMPSRKESEVNLLPEIVKALQALGVDYGKASAATSNTKYG